RTPGRARVPSPPLCRSVVTGGASAAYGADAVAGAVNFVLNREFEGLTARASTGITDQSDGENFDFSIAGGRGFLDGKLHVIGSLDRKSTRLNSTHVTTS